MLKQQCSADLAATIYCITINRIYDPNTMEEERINVKIELPLSLLAKIDDLRIEWGIRSRGDIIERLLQELFKDETTQGTGETENHQSHAQQWKVVVGLGKYQFAQDVSNGIAAMGAPNIKMKAEWEPITEKY